MSSEYFYKKNGSLSSIRINNKAGNHSMNITTYTDSGKGGTTYKSSASSSRISSSGVSLGGSEKFGGGTQYSGRNFTQVRSMPKF